MKTLIVATIACFLMTCAAVAQVLPYQSLTAPNGSTVITQTTDSSMCQLIEAQGNPCIPNVTVLITGLNTGLYEVDLGMQDGTKLSRIVYYSSGWSAVAFVSADIKQPLSVTVLPIKYIPNFDMTALPQQTPIIGPAIK